MLLALLSGALLSTTDAFFIAYQEHAQIPMHLGVDLVLSGPLRREHLLAALAAVRRRWPAAGRLVEIGLVGLRWGTETDLEQALVGGGGSRGKERPHPPGPLSLKVEGEEMAKTQGDTSHSTPLLRPAPPPLPSGRGGRGGEVLLDPFREPPFQVTWRTEGQEHALTLRAHHALFDGKGFLLATQHFLDALASSLAGHPTPPAEEHQDDSPRRVHRPRTFGLPQRARDVAPIEYLPLRSSDPGPCGALQVHLPSSAWRGLPERTGVGLPWWCMAVWLKALAAWREEASPGAPSLLTLEVPMSLRAALGDPLASGNHIAPLFLQGDSAQSPEQLARSLKEAFKSTLARREHLLESALASPGKFLPWPLFRRLAVAGNRTGNATSHAVFLRLRHAPEERVSVLSRGALELLRWAPYTPVCLRMGAALTALQTPSGLLLAVTFRRTSIPEERARRLLEHSRDELTRAASCGE